MSSVLNRQRASGSGAQGGDDAGYVIENSLRFNPPDSAHMDLTFGTPTSQKKVYAQLVDEKNGVINER